MGLDDDTSKYGKIARKLRLPVIVSRLVEDAKSAESLWDLDGDVACGVLVWVMTHQENDAEKMTALWVSE